MLCIHMQGSPGLVGAEAGGNIDEVLLRVCVCAQLRNAGGSPCQEGSGSLTHEKQNSRQRGPAWERNKAVARNGKVKRAPSARAAR